MRKINAGDTFELNSNEPAGWKHFGHGIVTGEVTCVYKDGFDNTRIKFVTEYGVEDIFAPSFINCIVKEVPLILENE